MSVRTLKYWVILGIGVIGLGLGAGCQGQSSVVDWPVSPGPKVLTSFAPLRCIVANVAGDRAAVMAVMSTQGPHHFQPSRSDARRLASADVFFINGLGLDNGIAAQMQNQAGKTKLRFVKVAEKLPEEMLLEGGCDCCKNESGVEHNHAHDEHASDPHVWLSIDHVIRMVEVIREELKAADPSDAAGYDRRAEEFTKRLQALKAEGVDLLKNKTERQFVSFHSSMAYFAKSFGLQEPEVLQDVAGHEPSPKQLKTVVDRCVAKKLRVIAVEPQYSSEGSARAIIDELKNRGIADPVVITLDPMETVADSEYSVNWYENKMRANLKALAGALK